MSRWTAATAVVAPLQHCNAHLSNTLAHSELTIHQHCPPPLQINSLNSTASSNLSPFLRW